MEQQQLKNTIEAVLMSAEKPLKVNEIENLFAGDADMPARDDIRKALQQLGEDYANRGFELKEVASGFRIQVKQDYSAWVGRLWEEKPARYSRALLETLALIAYRQPITRGEIEEIRGVSVSSNIIKTMMEREWIKVLGHKDVPGKPALYGTSKEFLDYFNLKSLEDLPTLAELKDLDQMHQELDLDIDNTAGSEQDDTARAGEADSAADDTTDNADADVPPEIVGADNGETATVEPGEAETFAADSETEHELATVDAEDESDEEEDYVETEPRAQSAAS
jgi:segregation and condensation protein B